MSAMRVMNKNVEFVDDNCEIRWKMLLHKKNRTVETDSYYNQEEIDKFFSKYEKGSFIVVDKTKISDDEDYQCINSGYWR